VPPSRGPSDPTPSGSPPAGATRALARFLVAARPGDLPAAVRREGARALVGWVGCALGGSHHEAVEAALAALAPFSGPPQATVIGRAERLDALGAALLNGIASHVLDYDDTHLDTVIHPAGPVASAILALAEWRPVPGIDFLNALVLGIETECRIGRAVTPAHYDVGWHITGTAGVFGAAAAAGKLLGLGERQMAWALGLAATQPVGLREMFGSMTKSFHPGRAAQNGLTAALLASRGFTSSEEAIEARRGWAHVVSAERDLEEITEGLGQRYETLRNTHKPFACGVVIHPAIDGCLQLRGEAVLAAEAVERIELGVHPLVLELTGKREPSTGLEGKFSVYHAAAVALVEGAAGPRQFLEAAVWDPAVVALRGRVSAAVDPALREDQARVAIVLRDGRRLERFVEHAVGSLARPMSDRDLEAKLLDLADGVLPAARARRLAEICWDVERLAGAAEIAAAAAGTSGRPS
jgi:2-methylcitrate dehydratase PrpD